MTGRAALRRRKETPGCSTAQFSDDALAVAAAFGFGGAATFAVLAKTLRPLSKEDVM
jgi:hypothetical protein